MSSSHSASEWFTAKCATEGLVARFGGLAALSSDVGNTRTCWPNPSPSATRAPFGEIRTNAGSITCVTVATGTKPLEACAFWR